MRGRIPVATLTFGWLVLTLLGGPVPAHAGLTDKLKKKASDSAKAAEKAVEGEKKPEAAKPDSASAGGTATPAASGGAAAPAGTGDPGKVSAISTKFDYVPGDSVMLVDDFRQDDLGEFPARWALAQGTYEVAEMDGERWLRCTSDDGRIRMKRTRAPLPEFWTLEFDFFGKEPMSQAVNVRGLAKDDRYAWEVTYAQMRDMVFRSGEIFASTPLEGEAPVDGRHHIMLMARGTGLKAYVDRQRLVNVPDVSAASGMPDEIEFRMFSPSHPMIGNVRFAEGCRPAKDMLAQGKLVTYGIRFATGSDAVLPESAPVLRQVAAYMEANPAVKLRITGHTDNVGPPAANLDLSKRRAASVARVLNEQFAIAADRFATDGKGDTQTLKSNASPEGRAMNRRVEFAKL
jgi:outer membrane protein OmpA-like peptidoglycan-associated protein